MPVQTQSAQLPDDGTVRFFATAGTSNKPFQRSNRLDPVYTKAPELGREVFQTREDDRAAESLGDAILAATAVDT